MVACSRVPAAIGAIARQYAYNAAPASGPDWGAEVLAFFVKNPLP